MAREIANAVRYGEIPFKVLNCGKTRSDQWLNLSPFFSINCPKRRGTEEHKSFTLWFWLMYVSHCRNPQLKKEVVNPLMGPRMWSNPDGPCIAMATQCWANASQETIVLL